MIGLPVASSMLGPGCSGHSPYSEPSPRVRTFGHAGLGVQLRAALLYGFRRQVEGMELVTLGKRVPVVELACGLVVRVFKVL
jgi:hypothetical protein